MKVSVTKDDFRRKGQRPRPLGLLLTVLLALCVLSRSAPAANSTELSWRSEYDDQGRLMRTFDPSGRATSYTFVAEEEKSLHSMTEVPPSGSPITWQADSAGRLAVMRDGEGELVYRYDRLGRLSWVERPGKGPAIQYSYDTLGRLVEIRAGDLYRIVWKYDFLGRVSRMETPAGPIDYDYQNGQGMVIRRLPNGIRTVFKRSASGQLLEILHGYSFHPADTNYLLRAQYALGYRADGRIGSIVEVSSRGKLQRQFEYDGLGRLTGATGVNGQVYVYEYNRVGDRIQATGGGRRSQRCEFDGLGRMTRIDGVESDSDAAGNQACLRLEGQDRKFQYLANGRLAEVSSAQTSVRYRYDGFGRQVVRESSEGETTFILDPLAPEWRPLVVLGPGKDRTLVIWDGPLPLALVRNGQTEWLLADHLGSVRMTADGKGQISTYLDYGPYGEAEGTASPRALFPGFAGMFWDSAAQGYVAGGRIYLPDLGRFLQPDSRHSVSPVALALEGLYHYARGNPISFVDRGGLASEYFDTTMGELNAQTVPDYLQALIQAQNRQVTEWIWDDQLRARAQAAEAALARAQEEGRVESIIKDPSYHSNKVTIFVRQFRPELFGSPVPHGGISFGETYHFSGVDFDGVELQQTRIGSQEGQTLVLPVRLQEQERGGVILLMPLETDKISVLFDGQVMPIRDLPEKKKAEIQNAVRIRALAEIGKTQGAYKLFGDDNSNHCIDLTFKILDQAVSDTGVSFVGDGFREHFTTSVGALKFANPTVYFGAAAQLPRAEGPFDDAADSLRDMAIDMGISTGLELGAEISESWSNRLEMPTALYGYYSFGRGMVDTVMQAKSQPGDSALDLSLTSIFLDGLELAGLGGGLPGLVSIELALADTIQAAVRSREQLNRATHLLSLGGAILPSDLNVLEVSLGRYEGGYSLRGTGIHGDVGYRSGAGRHYGWGAYDTTSENWSKVSVENLPTLAGATVSGTFTHREERSETGLSLWNLYQPTSETVRRYRKDETVVTRVGGMRLTLDEEKRKTVPTSSAPRQGSLAAEKPTPRLDEPKIPSRVLPADGGGRQSGPGDINHRGSEESGGSVSSRRGGWECPPFCDAPSPLGSLSASRVGGVYLGGAGDALKALGQVRGIFRDDNSGLSLLGEQERQFSLPPLQLDSVVTIFRSVYLYGQGPMVTLDPNPEDPEHSAMLVRHGEATEDTYVGWVLFQADRLMKGYAQGMDNMTQETIESKVPGYAQVLDTVYFGSRGASDSQQKAVWERFWIVPGEIQLVEGDKRKVTLLDVTLKVRTQRMRWVNNELADDLSSASSPGALAFSAWFTNNYDAIAAEQILVPPPESGITEGVPVFAELRRIALMTAVAEKLRDEGVPMPFWMHDYPVARVPLERSTPSLLTWRTNESQRVTARVFGGVALTGDSHVKKFSKPADVMKEPAESRARLEADLKLASHLELELAKPESGAGEPPPSLKQLSHEAHELQALTLPGAETLALSPLHLEEADLVVPLRMGREIRLVRSHHSFFDPAGPWGPGWALNLPRLTEYRVPLDTQVGAFTVGLQLTTPFNSLEAFFLSGKPVEAFNHPQQPSIDADSPFLGVSRERPPFLSVETYKVRLKDGREWYFMEQGPLIAEKDGPLTTVYERGMRGEVTRILGVIGNAIAGEILLTTDEKGRLVSAEGVSHEGGDPKTTKIIYRYDETGSLRDVSSDEGTVGYRHDKGQLTAITWQDSPESPHLEVLRRFTIDAQGRLLSEQVGATKYAYALQRSANALEASVSSTLEAPEESFTSESHLRYDAQRRPLEASWPDGTKETWVYPPAGGTVQTLITPDGHRLERLSSEAGRQLFFTAQDDSQISVRSDASGRLTEVLEDKTPVLRQIWGAQGQLSRVDTIDRSLSMRYDPSGLLSSVLLTPLGTQGETSTWLEIKLDAEGRPIQATDYSGMDIRYHYGEFNTLEAAYQKTTEGNLGYQIERESSGRVKSLSSSWETVTYTYGVGGELSQATVTKGDAAATLTLRGGRLESLSGFDGLKTEVGYDSDAPGRLRSIQYPEGLLLEYAYDAQGRLSSVCVGDLRRVALDYDSVGRLTAYRWASGGCQPGISP